MKGQSNALQQSSVGEILNLRLTTNQPSDSDILGAIITITDNIREYTYNWEGNEITLQFKAGTQYEITVSNIEGYKTPSIQRFYAHSGNVNNVILTYETEVITVNVYPEELTGYEVSIKKQDIVTNISEYTDIEYIEAAVKGPYIDTGFIPDSNTRVVLDAEVPDSSSAVYVLGVNDWTTGKRFQIRCTTSGTTYTSDYGSAGTNTQVTAAGRLIFDKNKNICTIGSKSVSQTVSTFECLSNLKLLAGVTTSGSHSASPGKIYSCQIYDNGVLIRDYKPVKNKEGVCGLYDKVTKTFTTSANINHSFIGGPEIVYKKIEYIESTGTQYIDTKFKPNNNTRVKLRAYNTSSSSGWIFGTWDTTNTNQFMISCLSTYSFRYGTQGVQLTTIPVNANLTVDFNKTSYNMNGTTGNFSSQTFKCSYTAYICAVNSGGNLSTGKFYGRIYSCGIYDNGTLVRDFVPVIRSTDNVAGLYDIVEGNFYASSGTGNFVAGPKVTSNIATQTSTTGIYKIPYNTNYIISASSFSGYTKPADIVYISNQPSKIINLTYEEGNSMGVFIQGVSGTLYRTSEWDNQETANGVAVITEECSFIIAPDQGLGGFESSTNSQYCYDSEEIALVDYNGVLNTAHQVGESGFNNYLDNGVICYEYLFPNGKRGYCPSLGEWKQAWLNKNAVDEALALIGGQPIMSTTTTFAGSGTEPTPGYMASSTFNKQSLWYFVWGTGGTHISADGMAPYLRPFQELEETHYFILKNRNTTYNSFKYEIVPFEPGMTWKQFINSDYNTINAWVHSWGDVDVKFPNTALNGYRGNGILSTSTTSQITIPSGTIIENKYLYYVYQWTECCFIPGTQILISLDGITKNIEKIQKGDTVISYDLETQQNYEAICSFQSINNRSIYMAKVTCANGTVLEMTEYHPLYTKDGWKSLTGYNNYPILQAGDIVKTIDDWDEIIMIEKYRLSEPITTYTLGIRDKDETLDVDINDGFYANGVLAHNAASPCAGPS